MHPNPHDKRPPHLIASIQKRNTPHIIGRTGALTSAMVRLLSRARHFLRLYDTIRGMEIFDTHAHFSCDAEKTAATLARAYEAGVSQLMAVGGSPELNRAAMLAATCATTVGEPAMGSAANTRPRVRLALGLDRDQATPGGGSCPRYDFSPIIDNRKSLAAVGEIGLDFHYAPETAKAQCDLFAAQLELARELKIGRAHV